MRNSGEVLVYTIISFFGLALILGSFWAIPQYNIYSQRASGEASLAHAESERKIATLTAKAQEESARYLAEAEITRAKGVAEANRIIGDSLKGNDGYLKYLWIQGMQTNQMQVIYVPTETNLPILESARWTEYEKYNVKDKK